MLIFIKNVNIKNLSRQCTGNILLYKIYNKCLCFKLNQSCNHGNTEHLCSYIMWEIVKEKKYCLPFKLPTVADLQGRVHGV